MEVLRKAPDPIFDSNLIPEFSEKPDDDDKKPDDDHKKNPTTTRNGVGEDGGWGWGRVGGVRGVGWGQVQIPSDTKSFAHPHPPSRHISNRSKVQIWTKNSTYYPFSPPAEFTKKSKNPKFHFGF